MELERLSLFPLRLFGIDFKLSFIEMNPPYIYAKIDFEVKLNMNISLPINECACNKTDKITGKDFYKTAWKEVFSKF